MNGNIQEEERVRLLSEDEPISGVDLTASVQVRQPISPSPGTVLSNRWKYYQYLNIDLRDSRAVPKAAMNATHVLSYDETLDDELGYGGENVLMPAASKEDLGKSSLLSSMFNLTTTMVGGGTLSIPYAIAAAGVALGPIIIMISAFFAALAAHLLVHMSMKSASPSYKDISIDAFGVIGAKIVELIIVVFTFGASVAYLVIMGDFIKPVLNLCVHGLTNTPLCPKVDGVEMCVWYLDHKFYVAVWALCVCTPLALLKKMSMLKYTSVVSLLATCYIVTVVIVRSIQSGFTLPDVVLFNWDVELFVSFPIFLIAFTFHMNIAPVQMELANPTPKRVVLACTSGIGISIFLYLFMGVFGYLLFGHCVASNVLSSFTDNSDVLVQVGRIAFLLVVTTAFPLIIYPLRMNLQTLIFRVLKPNNLFHWISTIVVIAMAYGIAISGVSIGLVFGLMGSTCGIVLIYVFPALLYLKLNRGEKWWSWRKIYSYFAIGFGMVMMGLCLYATIQFNGFVAPGCAPNSTNATNSTGAAMYDFQYEDMYRYIN